MHFSGCWGTRLNEDTFNANDIADLTNLGWSNTLSWEQHSNFFIIWHTFKNDLLLDRNWKIQTEKATAYRERGDRVHEKLFDCRVSSQISIWPGMETMVHEPWIKSSYRAICMRRWYTTVTFTISMRNRLLEYSSPSNCCNISGFHLSMNVYINITTGWPHMILGCSSSSHTNINVPCNHMKQVFDTGMQYIKRRSALSCAD